MFDFIRNIGKQKGAELSPKEIIQRDLNLFSHLVEYDPLDYMALRARAICHFRLQEWNNAIKSFETVIHLKKDFFRRGDEGAQEWLFIAYCYRALGNRDLMHHALIQAGLEDGPGGVNLDDILMSQFNGYVSQIQNDGGRSPFNYQAGRDIFV